MKFAPVVLPNQIDDIALGIANVLIALHQTKQIDLTKLLPELAAVSTKTWLQRDGEDRRPSHTSLRLQELLTTQLQWGGQTPPAAP